MSAVVPDHVLAQIVTEDNANVIPIVLAFAEMKLRAVGHGMSYASKSDIDELGISQRERFAWLSSGTQVRVVKYAVNGGFAAKVELIDERNLTPRVNGIGSTIAFLLCRATLAGRYGKVPMPVTVKRTAFSFVLKMEGLDWFRHWRRVKKGPNRSSS